MDLNPYLNECQLDSSGNFSLSLSEGLEKVSQFQLTDPSRGPLALVAGALRSGAEALSLEISGYRATYSLKVSEPDPEEFGPLIWALAVNRPTCRWIRLACPARGKELVMKEGKVELTPLSRTLPAGRIEICLERVKGLALEQEALPRHCGLCPVPFEFKGRPLQVNLGDAFRGLPAAWSGSVPPLLRPGGSPELATDLAIFLRPSTAPKPIWVAVVQAISYPFLLPEAGAREGVIWSSDLQVDLGLTQIVRDAQWDRVRSLLVQVARGARYKTL